MLTTETTTLPLWVLLIFCIVMIGIGTLIYSRGNWRTALLFSGLASTIVLTITGLNAWSDFIKTHFIGQFDQLGIPFNEAGPGWNLLKASWQLWSVPSFIFTLIGTLITYWVLHGFSSRLQNSVQRYEKNSPSNDYAVNVADKSLDSPVPFTNSIHDKVANKLELESLKHDLVQTREKLTSAIDIAEKQVDRNQDLEIQMLQIEEEQAENLIELQDKIAVLELEISTKETENDELTSLALQQAEEIAKLKALHDDL